MNPAATPVDYEHDVFISYCRSGNDYYVSWVREHFRPRLQSALRMSTRCRKGVFVDKDIPTASDWAGVLRREVARSKIMVSLLCGEYFSPDKTWTRKEMALMMARERHLGLSASDPRHRIIIPIRIRDGEWWPELIRERQLDDFSTCYNSDFYTGAPTGIDFGNKIENLAKIIGDLAGRVPPCHSSFESLDDTSLFEQLVEKPEMPPRFPSLH